LKQFAHYLRRALKPSIYFSALLICASCAQTGLPSGGAKDTEGPKVVQSQPEFGETNYDKSFFSLEFDEYVVGTQINNELIISPPLPEGSETTVKGKKLIIEFADSLKTNTTYILSLRKGIRDLNESNVLDSNIWVFSTGPFLDSGDVKGMLFDAFTKEALKDAMVMLYLNQGDSLAYKDQPDYLVQSDENGQFNFAYLPAELDFKIVGLVDENADYLFSMPSESIGFNQERIAPGNDSLKLYFFKEESSLAYVKDYRQFDAHHIQLKFSEPIWDLKVSGIGFDILLEDYDTDFRLDSVFLNLNYKGRELADSLQIRVQLNESVSDTFYLVQNFLDSNARFCFPKISKRIEMGSAIQFTSYREISAQEKAELWLFNETDTHKLLLESRSYHDFSAELPDTLNGKYKFLIPDSVFYLNPIYYSDSSVGSLEVYKPDDAPDIKVLSDAGPNIIVDLLNPKGKAIARIKDSESFVFKDLPVGEYGLRLIRDANRNGYWTSGNYLEKRQAEKVYYYPDVISLKKGFDFEADWNPKD